MAAVQEMGGGEGVLMHGGRAGRQGARKGCGSRVCVCVCVCVCVRACEQESYIEEAHTKVVSTNGIATWTWYPVTVLFQEDIG